MPLMNSIRTKSAEGTGQRQYLYSTIKSCSHEHAAESICRQNVKKKYVPMEILTAIAIAPFLAALVLGAREAEIEEQKNR